MYKNQLQELAQRSCFNLPAYTTIREGPDHAPRFKAVVNFNGETFESPSYCSTLRQAEHSAAEVALNALAGRGPSNSLAARILDETGVYKNLLQEVSQRVGASLPAYSTFRTGLGHLPIFTCTVELAGVIFTGEPAKNKKQAEKNAAMAAWLSLKSLVQKTETPYEKKTFKDEQEHVTVARALQKYILKARLARISFPIKFPTLNPRPSNTQQSPTTSSKILPFICPETAQGGRPNSSANTGSTFQKNVRRNQSSQPMAIDVNDSLSSLMESLRSQNFPAVVAAPYIPVRHCNPHNRSAPPVTIRNAIPVFSAPPLPPPQSSLMMRPPTLGTAPPMSIRQAVPVFANPVRIEERPMVLPSVKVDEEPPFPKLRVDDLSWKKPVLMAPNPEALTVQVKLPKSQPEPPVISEKTASAEQDKLQELAEIDGVRDLKTNPEAPTVLVELSTSQLEAPVVLRPLTEETFFAE